MTHIKITRWNKELKSGIKNQKQTEKKYFQKQSEVKKEYTVT